MYEQGIRVWVQRFYDRPTLILQWVDPDTGQRKSQSAKTTDFEKAEIARRNLETTDFEKAEIARRNLEYELKSRYLPRNDQIGMEAIPRAL